MTQTNALSEIIRPVTEHAKANGGEEALIVIDARTGQAVPTPGFLETLTGDFRYFLVSNTGDPKKTIKGTKQVRYKEGQGEILFAIGYEGGCQPGREWWFAQCFFKSARSEDQLRASLANWLMEYFSSGGRAVDDFEQEKTRAANDLATRASQEFGLELKIDLRVEMPGTLETIEVGPMVITSRLKDLDEDRTLWFKAELQVDRQRFMRALLHQKTALTDVLTKGVRRYLADSVSLDAFCDDLNSEQIKRELSAHLNKLLEPFGRQTAFLSLKPDVDGNPTTFKGGAEIEFLHHEYPDPIKIKVSALMVPTNRAVYLTKGAPRLDEWLERNLREVINEVLFGVPYVDLLLDFKDLKKKIDDLMSQRAMKIGFDVKHLMTILFLEPFEWLKRIDIEIKCAGATSGQSSEALFETSLSDFYVGLEIFLTARVKDLRGIARYLSTKQSVPKRMKEEIVRMVRTTMHGTDPERFYMRYSEPDNEKYPNEQAFEEELREKIESLVEAEFNAEVLDLVLKPMETDLTRKLDQVSKASHDFEATAQLGTLPGAPAILVKGSFKVDGVSAERDGWKTFKDCDASVEAIRKRIEDSIRARLKGAPDDQSIFAAKDGLNQLIKRALFSARDIVRDEFGLAIRLTTVYWDWDEGLKRIGREQSSEEIAAVQERLSRLKEKRLDQIENDVALEEIQEVEESIRRLSATLPPALASSVGVMQLPEAASTKRLEAANPDET